jgi:hypothetical protein
MIAIASFLVWIGREYWFVRQRLALLNELNAWRADEDDARTPKIPFLRTLMGDQPIERIVLHSNRDYDYELILWAFPEAKIDPRP